MEKPCLNDAAVFPDDAVLSHYLGGVKPAWDTFMDVLHKDYPAFSGEWRYYNDGKSWLFKVTKKKKTICWVSVYERKFKTTFYFSDKAETLITQSELDKDYIEQFINGKRYGKIRGVTVEITESSAIAAIKLLIEIKEQIK